MRLDLDTLSVVIIPIFVFYHYLSADNIIVYAVSNKDESNEELDSESDCQESNEHVPQEDLNEDDPIEDNINNDNLIPVNPKHGYKSNNHYLSKALKSKVASSIYNLLKDRKIFLELFRSRSGIYFC